MPKKFKKAVSLRILLQKEILSSSKKTAELIEVKRRLERLYEERITRIPIHNETVEIKRSLLERIVDKLYV